jgi:hypothetical protein
VRGGGSRTYFITADLISGGIKVLTSKSRVSSFNIELQVHECYSWDLQGYAPRLA